LAEVDCSPADEEASDFVGKSYTEIEKKIFREMRQSDPCMQLIYRFRTEQDSAAAAIVFHEMPLGLADDLNKLQ
jgi:hypothetical protein